MLVIVGGIVIIFLINRPSRVESIKIGIIQSNSNIQSNPKNFLIEAAKLALKEINQKGGLLGRSVEFRLIDSDNETFVQNLEKIILEENINVLFGCLTSLCLNKVKPIIEKYRTLLFFPASYEGFDQSVNVIYLGSVPNQQIMPGIRWALDHLGNQFYLIGSYEMRSLISHQMARDLAEISKAKVIGEKIISQSSLESKINYSQIVNEIKALEPQFIFNTLTGEANESFIKALSEAGLKEIPTMFSVLDERTALEFYNKYKLKNIYSLENYYDDLPSESNRRFVANLKSELGNDVVVNSDMESIYTSIYLWAETVKQKKSLDPLQVNNESLLRQSFPGPSGVVAIDAMTRHAWKFSMIVKLARNGHFELMSRSANPIKPSPWPVYRTRDEWSELLANKLKTQEYSQ